MFVVITTISNKGHIHFCLGVLTICVAVAKQPLCLGVITIFEVPPLYLRVLNIFEVPPLFLGLQKTPLFLGNNLYLK